MLKILQIPWVTPIMIALLEVIYWGGYFPHCFLSNRCDDDIGGFNQIPVSELHIAAISETPVIPTQHETLCLPFNNYKDICFFLQYLICLRWDGISCRKRIQWCQNIEHPQSVSNIDACLPFTLNEERSLSRFKSKRNFPDLARSVTRKCYSH